MAEAITGNQRRIKNQLKEKLMTDTKQEQKDKSGKSGSSFPCGNFEKMLEKMREINTGETGSNACTSIMKQFGKGKEKSFDCRKVMQQMCTSKDDDIDCKAVMKELFSGVTKKTDPSE
jgi:hypothetical protein